MKTKSIFLSFVLFFTMGVLCAQEYTPIPKVLATHKNKKAFTALKNNDTADRIPLFNGKDLSGWYTYTEKYGKNNDAAQQFAVDNGVLHFDGADMGYLCTNKSYENYYLRIVFRWGYSKYEPRLDGPRDSGVLYHFSETASDGLWPTSIECQIQESDCGDYWFVGGTDGHSPNASSFEWDMKRVVKTANYENSNPNWNVIELVCIDNKSEHYVNGQLVNQAFNLNISKGKILLQLEGAEIYYKTIEMIPLK